MDQEANSPYLIPQHKGPVSTLAPAQLEIETSERRQVREKILEDINTATQRYLSCDDPTEAAARRLRVLASEKNGQVDETVENMLNEILPPAVAVHQTTQHEQFDRHITREQVMEELNDVTIQYLSCTDPSEARARQQRVIEGDAIGLEEEVAARILATPVVVPESLNAPLYSRNSPPVMYPNDQVEEERVQQENSDSDVPPRRRNPRTEARNRPSNGSPNILSGVSSRKRNISGMKFSPARRNSATQTKSRNQASSTGNSSRRGNPPIQLIPAVTRKKEDFRAAPPQAP